MKELIAQGLVDINVSRHYCDMTKYAHDGYGKAISYCEERADGTLWEECQKVRGK